MYTLLKVTIDSQPFYPPLRHMPSRSLKNKILSTSMLVAPIALALASGVTTSSAYAGCSVTSGGGTVASPANGSTITCFTSDGSHTSTIGDGTDGVAATVRLQAGANVFVAGRGVELDDVTLTLGTGSQLATTGDNNYGVFSYSNGNNLNSNITLGENASIRTNGVFAPGIYTRSPNGAVDQTVVLKGDGSNITTNGDSSSPLYLFSTNGDVNHTITLSGDNSYFRTTGDGSTGIFTRSRDNTIQSLTLSGEGAHIDATGSGSIAWSYQNNDTLQVVTLSGSNTYIKSTRDNFGYGLNAYSEDGDTTQIVTLSGDNSRIYTLGNNSGSVFAYTWSDGNIFQTITLSGNGSQIYSRGDNSASAYAWSRNSGTGNTSQTITLSGSGANITATGTGSEAISSYASIANAQADVTLGRNTSVISSQSAGILVFGGAGGNPGSSIDSAGLIQGGTNSILLDDGNDTLTLRTGSNLSSPTGADMGAGNDTLILIGNGSEDETFLNIETLNVNANAFGWNFTTTSTFDDINLNSGLFRNNGALTVNDLIVNNGATFGGSGMITGDITNDGVVAPGNSIGTQTIIGNFVQNAGGTLAIEIDGAGNSDLLDITGTATLDGTVRFSGFDAGSMQVGDTYTFIQTTGGVAGGFSDVEDTLLFVDVGNVMTVGNDVRASIVSRDSFTSAASNKNQLIAAQTLDSLVSARLGGDIDLAINSLSSIDEASDFLESQSNTITLNSISSVAQSVGEVLNVVQQRMSSFVSNATNSIFSRDSSSLAQITPAAGEEYGSTGYVWGQIVGGFGDVDSSSQARGSDYQTYGFAVGIDRQLDGKDAYLGIFGAFSHTDTEMKGLQDSADIQNYQAGVYGFKRLSNKLHLNGSLSASWLDFETYRPTVTGNAKGDFNGYGIFGHVEAMYDIERDGYIFSPYLGLETSHIYQESYDEGGAGALNMNVDSSSTHTVSSEIGVQLQTEAQVEEVIFTPTFKLGWQHEFGDSNSKVTSNFTTAPSAVFESEGPEQARDSARIMLDMNFAETGNDNKNLYVRYDGKLSSTSQNHALTAGIKIEW